MSDFKSNFPLYQLILSEVEKGNAQKIYNWRNNTYQNWENKHAIKCSPLHIRSISFLWKQSTAVNLGDLPEFTFCFNITSFNERASNKLFPDVKVNNSQYTLNDVRLKPQEDVKYDDETPPNQVDSKPCTYVGVVNDWGRVTDVTPEFAKEAVVLTIADLAGSRDVALRFIASFTEPIDTFDEYFTPRVQTRLREALEKVYTIMQTITPTRYLNYVLKGGEFHNFNELFNRICEDRHIMKETPSVPQSFLFLRDIRNFKQYTARSKAIAIEEKLSDFCFSYADKPIKIGEVSSKHTFSGKDQYSPILAYNTMAILMSPLSDAKQMEIFTGLATKLCKAVKQLTMRDILENKLFIHDQIDLATGAQKDFCLEDWSKQLSDTDEPASTIKTPAQLSTGQ